MFTCVSMSYLQFSLLRFVDHLWAVPQDVAVQDPKVLNVVSDDVGHLGLVFSNHHPEIPYRVKDRILSLFINKDYLIHQHITSYLCCMGSLYGNVSAGKHLQGEHIGH